MAHPFSKNTFLDEIVSPRRIAFIVNPAAGTQLQKRLSTHLEKHLNHRLYQYTTFMTECRGHGTELARVAASEGYEVVVAVGGDGSINEVAKGLVGTQSALGIVPAGSGNGFAMCLGYGRTMGEAIRKLNLAQEKWIDCGKMNGELFINVAGLGFDGMVSNLMQGQEKRGFATYFLKSLEAGWQYQSKDCIIEADGAVVQAKCFAVAIANGTMYGYNFQIAPDAVLDDGFFEVVILKDAPRWQYFAALPATLRGEIYQENFVQHFQAKRIKIVCPGENFVHIDGEGRKMEGVLHFELMPKSLKIMVPRTAKEP